MAGFLPPITESGNEVGWASFSADSNSNLSTGTQIKNQAFVNFDGVGPFNPAPKEGPFTNTIDSAAPNSSMTVKLMDGNMIQLNWMGEDDLNGSGVKDYTIYFSDDGKPYETLLSHTKNTSYLFSGEEKHTYAFYSISRDNVGNIEAAPEEPDVIQYLYHHCDLNLDGIYIHDYNDLMTAYKCFLGITGNCGINYRDWNLMKKEYQCFVGNP